VLVVDNGSTDSTRRIAESFADRLPGLRVADAGARPGLSYACNTGLAAARGDFIANCDADDVAERGWLAGLVAQAADFDLVGGWCDRTALNDPRIVRAPSRRERRLPGGPGHQSFAQGGNLGVWRSVAEAVGGWDESFMHGCEDIDFSWKVRRQGYSLGFAEHAVIQIRLRSDRRGSLRQGFNWGRGDAQLYSRYSVGMKRISVYRWLRAVLGLSAMGLRYRRLDGPGRLGWWYEVGRRVGRLAGSWENRVWYP
jgi:glycosyltransferase involved in cell wall biosynthesis